MKKYQFWKRSDGSATDVQQLMADTRQTYINRIYNLWMDKFEWDGLDEEMAAKEENFIMRKFWADGTVAVREHAGLLIFAPWTLASIDMYDFPSTVNLVNRHAAPLSVIPSTTQTVDKDVVLGWCQPNHKSILSVVSYYIDRMVSVDMVINTNLQLQKMPFLIGTTEEDKKRLQDVVDRLLNNETVIFTDLEDLQKIQAIITATPYIIDKLTDLRNSYEKELLTFLGIDNNASPVLEQTHISVDAVNANNDEINDNASAIMGEIQKWLDSIERVFGRRITIKPKHPTQSVHEEPKDMNTKEDVKDVE